MGEPRALSNDDDAGERCVAAGRHRAIVARRGPNVNARHPRLGQMCTGMWRIMWTTMCTSGGREKDFWGRPGNAVDNPVNSEIPLDLVKRDRQTVPRTGKRMPTGTRGTASSEWRLQRWDLHEQGSNRVHEAEAVSVGSDPSGRRSRGPGNRAARRSTAGDGEPGDWDDDRRQAGERTGQPGSEAATSAQPTRATGLEVPSQRDHPPERKL